MTLSGLKKAFNRAAVRLTLGLTLLFSGLAVNLCGYNRMLNPEFNTAALVGGGVVAIAGLSICLDVEL